MSSHRLAVALTPVQCIHYCLTRPAVASVLAGYQSVEEAQAALAYEQASEEERDFAQVIADAPARKAYFGQCTYCGHCQPCAVGIDIATVNKFADRSFDPRIRRRKAFVRIILSWTRMLPIALPAGIVSLIAPSA